MQGNKCIPLETKQHPVLPIVMLLAGASPLISNGYPTHIQLVGFLLGALGGFLALLSCRNKGVSDKNSPFWLGLLFLVWMSIGLFWSVDVNSTVNEIMRTVLYLLVYWQVRTTFGKKEIDKIFTIFILAGFLVASFGILQYLFIKAGRINATFINPNPLELYLGMVFLLFPRFSHLKLLHCHNEGLK
ncbi:MAG: hypothetical protein PWP31_73 [Clostridia bacterium]|nr:hypothetical protein [Clostridia bacterium]